MSDSNELDPVGDELRDLLGKLRAEYESDDAKDVLPPESLEDCDEPTRRAVGWMRSAWEVEAQREGAEAQTLVPPMALARAARKRTQPFRARHAAVAVVASLAAAALLAMVLWERDDRGPRTEAEHIAATASDQPAERNPSADQPRKDPTRVEPTRITPELFRPPSPAPSSAPARSARARTGSRSCRQRARRAAEREQLNTHRPDSNRIADMLTTIAPSPSPSPPWPRCRTSLRGLSLASRTNIKPAWRRCMRAASGCRSTPPSICRRRAS